MAQSLYTAASGMVAQQNKIDTLANNIANINTQGFKRQRVDFADTIYRAMNNPAQPETTDNLLRGTGSLTAATSTDLAQGPLLDTGRNLDVAISGQAFFAVADGEGKTLYTRNGVFHSGEINGQHFLLDDNSRFVLDQNGQPIVANNHLEELSVGDDGLIINQGQHVARLGLFDFINPMGLLAAGGRTWEATEASGEPTASVDFTLSQGVVEGSNVDLSEEMTQLVESQRAYTFLARAITTADDMMGTANDIRR